MPNSKRKKPVVSVLVFILAAAVTIGALHIADNVLKEKSKSGVLQGLALYDQPKNSIDVVVLGSSHVHWAVNPAKMWDDYGITAYDFSSAEQPLWVSYYYLKEICKTQDPKVVVLDFFAPAAFQEDHKFKYTFLADQVNGLKFSPNKVALMAACFDGKAELWDKHFPNFFGYHDRYDALTDEDWEAAFGADYSYFKGYTPVFEMTPVQDPSLNYDEIKAPSEKSQKYLDKIVEFTKENDIELYLTIVPYQVNVEQVSDVVQEEDKRYNWLNRYVSDLQEDGVDNVHFDYTFQHIWDFDIDFTGGTDIADGNSHLNYYGGTKFSDYLARDLRSLYGEELLPDHRDDPYYSSWDDHSDYIRDLAEENGWEYH